MAQRSSPPPAAPRAQASTAAYPLGSALTCTGASPRPRLSHSVAVWVSTPATRPVSAETLTTSHGSIFLSRDGASGTPGFLCVCQAAGRGVVELRLVSPGSDLSEELAFGVEPAALDIRAAPGCPPGLAFAAARRSSAIMIRRTWSASRRFRQRMASLGLLPAAILVS